MPERPVPTSTATGNCSSTCTCKRDPDAILQRFDPEQRLRGLDPEQRLRGLDPEQRLKGLDPEQRLKGLDPATIEAWLARQRQEH